MSESVSSTTGPDRDNGAHETDGQDDDSQHDDSNHPRKRQRVRLSCLECRRRKLSCSRELPCDRCIKSGTPDKCTYESRPGGTTVSPAVASLGGPNSIPVGGPSVAALANGGRGSVQSDYRGMRRDVDPSPRDAIKDHDRIRKLELEVAQLRSALSKQASSVDGTTVAASPSTLKEGPKESPLDIPLPSFMQRPGRGDGLEFKFVRGHNFKTRFFGPHNAWSSLKELAGIHPFMKETAEEWLRPLNIARKDRKKRKDERERQFAEPDTDLEALLPSKEETDSLIAVYLDQFEQLHRIIHVPTFKEQYESFWDPCKTRCAAFTALVLCMLATSSCLNMQASKYAGVKSSSHQTAEEMTKACDAWLDRQSQKHRRMIHYQIMCISYLAKRVNVIKKKRFWTSAGAMIREGIIVGLHQDGDQVASRVTPYYREMRRRVWATMVEFDIQASFDQGVPTLLSQITVDTKPPRNIDDEDFDENSEDLPTSKTSTEYTYSSYQNLSRQSLQTRLELNRVMTGPMVNLDWEQVTRYTEMITQEIDALPPWDSEEFESTDDSRKPLLAHTLLHMQLRQYLIPLHQPYLKLRLYNSKYQIAEFIYYNTARDIVLMHDRLFQKNIRALYFLREDTMHAAISLCSISIHQPKDSNSLIISNASETLKLIEMCIAMKEDRVLRCGNNDPWGYSSMCAALGLLETHLGNKTFEAAKASAAERFISLHYKLLAYQIPPFAAQQADSGTPGRGQDPVDRAKSITPFPMDGSTAMQLGSTSFHRDGMPLSMPWLMPQADQNHALVPNPDLNLELIGMDLNDLWGEDWTGADFM
ncbi:C6 zinc finger domain-containing protein [Xylariales sp. AK1849]|nr:C6 zinc finger domain-containing protein [Xylariales sp. AK1849]